MKPVLTVLFLLFCVLGAQAEAPVLDGVRGMAKELNGREVYVQSCAMCHANGVGGAPRPGRPDDWTERMKNGPADLLLSVLRGKGGMPPKGGNASLTRAEAYVALDFMLNGSK